jgi:hypothetical protein
MLGRLSPRRRQEKTQRVRLGFLFLASDKWSLGFWCLFFQQTAVFF